MGVFPIKNTVEVRSFSIRRKPPPPPLVKAPIISKVNYDRAGRHNRNESMGRHLITQSRLSYLQKPLFKETDPWLHCKNNGLAIRVYACVEVHLAGE